VGGSVLLLQRGESNYPLGLERRCKLTEHRGVFRRSRDRKTRCHEDSPIRGTSERRC
jgi:hypothetical protein